MKKAQKIRNIAFGCFGVLILGIILFIFIKHRKTKMNTFDEKDEENYEYQDEYGYNEDIENNYEQKIDKSDEELFRRVNKSEFKLVNDDKMNLKENTEQINKDSSEEDEGNKEIIDNYFKNLDKKRKGKHF